MNRKEKREYAKKYYQKNKKKIQEQSKKYNQRHKKEAYERSKKWKRENKEKVQKITDAWRKKNPEKMEGYRKKYYQKNREGLLRRAKERHLIIRMEVLIHYGGSPPKCACCGESTFEFLAIDHIEGGGNAHRAALGRKGSTGYYEWLKKNNYPKNIKLRVLCHNCNQSHGHYGTCPHKKRNLFIQEFLKEF